MVRKDLSIRYRDKEIKELYEIQFLIANTGDKSIRDIIEPLKIELPENCNLLDVTLLYVKPEGREINIDISEEKRIKLIFPLLNSGEFFIIKLLLDGDATYKDFKFTIVSDELPPVLKEEFLDFNLLGTDKKKRNDFEPGMFFTGIICSLFGAALIILIYNNFANILNELWLIIICCIPTIIFPILGIILIVESLISLPSKKPKFIVPDDNQLLKQNFPKFIYDELEK